MLLRCVCPLVEQCTGVDFWFLLSEVVVAMHLFLHHKACDLFSRRRALVLRACDVGISFLPVQRSYAIQQECDLYIQGDEAILTCGAIESSRHNTAF